MLFSNIKKEGKKLKKITKCVRLKTLFCQFVNYKINAKKNQKYLVSVFISTNFEKNIKKDFQSKFDTKKGF